MVEEKLLINEEQAKGLVLRLSEIGLFLRRPTGVESGPFGWIDVESPQKNHPKTDAVGEKCNIGFLGEKYLFFCHLDKEFPEDYHGRLRKLYEEVMG